MKPGVFSIALAGLLATAGMSALHAQVSRPRAELTPIGGSATAHEGSKMSVKLKVKLPPDVHVQSDKPRDRWLIPTALTLDPPPGVAVDKIVYPPPTDFVQNGQARPLAVFGPEFTIDVHLTVTSAQEGAFILPARLRYQACDESTCFPPATAQAQWAVNVTR